MTENEVKLEKLMKAFDCTKCPNRTSTSKVTNLGTQCRLGYKQNPKTVQASKNFLANNGRLCIKHPLKYETL